VSTAIQLFVDDRARDVVLHEDGCPEAEAAVIRALDGDARAAVAQVDRERLSIDRAVGADRDRRIRGTLECSAHRGGEPGQAARRR